MIILFGLFLLLLIAGATTLALHGGGGGGSQTVAAIVTSTSDPVSAIPEPSAALLFAVGLIGLVVLRRLLKVRD